MIYQVELHAYKHGRLTYIVSMVAGKTMSKAIDKASKSALKDGFTGVTSIRTTEYEQPSTVSPF
jgi:hypothetical protein